MWPPGSQRRWQAGLLEAEVWTEAGSWAGFTEQDEVLGSRAGGGSEIRVWMGPGTVGDCRLMGSLQQSEAGVCFGQFR